MGEEGLHRAAQKRRDRERAEARAAKAEATAKAAKAVRSEKKVKAYRVREALAEAGWFGKIVTNGALGVGLFGPMVIFVFVWGDEGILPIFATTIACAIGAFGMLSLAEIVVASMRLRKLVAIGRGLDVDTYLAALAENRRHAAVEVRAHFARPWPDDARANAPDAVREWMPALERVEWTGRDTLVMRTASLDGTIYLSGGHATSGGRHFDNRAIHGAFMQIVHDVVPHLEEVAPIDRLAVAIDGSIEAWDADP
ncbi:MAG TPA: hypothetical protein VL463_02260 [Kofleriaceae bacterium]|nr:hypothetical protein [Kofleriaceae bacterium]